jgi:hypothetical protein
LEYAVLDFVVEHWDFERPGLLFVLTGAAVLAFGGCTDTELTVLPDLGQASLHVWRRPRCRRARGTDLADVRQGGTGPGPATLHSEVPLAVSETEMPGSVTPRGNVGVRKAADTELLISCAPKLMGLELVFELVFLRQKAKVKGRPSEFGELSIGCS